MSAHEFVPPELSSHCFLRQVFKGERRGEETWRRPLLHSLPWEHTESSFAPLPQVSPLLFWRTERKSERTKERERERERERMLGSTTIVRITYEPTVCLHLTFFFMSSNSIQGRWRDTVGSEARDQAKVRGTSPGHIHTFLLFPFSNPRHSKTPTTQATKTLSGLSVSLSSVYCLLKDNKELGDPSALPGMVAEAYDAAEFIRTHVVQAEVNEKGNYGEYLLSFLKGSLFTFPGNKPWNPEQE